MSSSPRRSRKPSTRSPRHRLARAALVAAIALCSPASQERGAAATSYTLSGSPDGTGPILVDDDIEIFLNGVSVFASNKQPNQPGDVPPYPFTANVGDTLRFKVYDTYGDCASLSPLYLTDSSGRSALAYQGFNDGCGRGTGNLGQVRDVSFPIPDLSKRYVAERVADIRPGALPSAPNDLVVFNGALYFRANDGVHGDELWRLDAGASTPVMVADMVVGSGSFSPTRLTVAGNYLYFGAVTSAEGFELWRYSGTGVPTLVEDINPGSAGSSLLYLTALGDQLVFRAYDPAIGEELFAYDPVAGLTRFDIDSSCPSDCSSNPYGLTVYDGVLYFGASEPGTNTELYSYDGNTVERLTDLPGGGTNPDTVTGVGGRLIYGANLYGQIRVVRSFDIASRSETDLPPFNVNQGPMPVRFTRMGNVVYFAADDGTNGRELWLTDGTVPGTKWVADIFPGPSSSNPSALIPLNDEMLFSATDGSTGTEPRATIGFGSRLVADLNPGSGGSGFAGAIEMADLLFFVSAGAGAYQHPWVTNGSANGTDVIRTANGDLINPTGDSIDDEEFTPFDGALYFAGNDGVTGFELWRINVGNVNRAPTAVATAPNTVQAGTNCSALVTLDGSGSTDPDLDALTYSWSVNGVQTDTGATAQISLPVGTHLITLTVTDPTGATDSADVTVTVTSAVTVSYTGPNLLQQFGSNIVQASVSDANGPIDGAAITFTVNGTQFQAVSDATGFASVDVGPIAGAPAIIGISYAGAPCGPATTTVTVAVNPWPTITPSAPSPVFVGPACTASVQLSANASADVLTYAWTEGGAPVSVQANPTLSLSPGLHTFDLAVSDGQGGSATGSVTVDVRKELLGLQYTGPANLTVGVAAQLTARLTDSASTPIAGATIAFTLTGTTVQGTTDGAGVATVSLTPGNNGIQELVVSYGGDSCRDVSTFKTSVTVVRPTATIVVVKNVINDDGGTLLQPSDFTLSVQAPDGIKPVTGDANGQSVTIDAGAYLVTEPPNPNYIASFSADCSGTLAAGETKTCTVTNNDKPATLTLKKVVVNDNGGTLTAATWTLFANGVPYLQDVATRVQAGSFVLAESGSGGYTASPWNCGTAQVNGTTVTVPKHTDVVCTITNDDEPATLTLSKNVTNNNGGTAAVGDFPLSANGVPFVSGVSQPVNAGNYTLAEANGAAGYTPLGWTCTGGTLTGNTVAIGLGATVSCAITNDDTPGTLNVQAQIITNDGGVLNPATVTIVVGGVAATPASFPPPGAVVTVNTGNYAVSTGPVPGFTITYSPDCSGFMPLAGSKSCNITIDDDAPQPQAPTANSQSVQTNEDTALNVTLTATDPNNDPLVFSVVSQPAHGSLSGTVPDLVYTPAANYNGPDSFTFKANDGTLDSNIATITITVAAINDEPTATAGVLTTAEDTAAALTLTGFDADGDPLTFTVTTAPQHGTLSGAAPNLTYTPAADYSGPDTVGFTVSDGGLTSAPAAIAITVTAVNDGPTATPQTLSTAKNTPLPITLTASDPDSATLTFAVATGPAHGVIQGTGASLTYVPAANYVGPDSFSFTASDGVATSSAATIAITVTDANSAPVADSQSVTTLAGVAKALTLTGSDADNDPLSFTVLAPPAHGQLTGVAPDVTYTPDTGYSGPDSFTFKVNDGKADSNVATVSITVVPINANLAVFLDGPATIEIGQPLTYTVRVLNIGPDPLPGAQVNVSLPAGLNYTTASPCTGTSPVVCDAGPLAAGQERPFLLVTTPVSPGPITATASVTDNVLNDSNDSASLSTQVGKATSATVLQSAPATSTYGQSVTLTATVTGYSPGGTVTFIVDGVALGSSTLVNGAASVTTSALATGTRNLTASYGGDANNQTSTSAPLSHVVQPVTSVVVLSSSQNPSTAGQPVTFTATVTGAAPTGTITFTIDNAAQPPVALSGGSATLLSAALAAGTHTVIASYSGDSNNTTGVSNQISQIVQPITTATALTATPNPSTAGQIVTLSATVTGGTPTGVVTFQAGATALGQATVTNGVATLPVAFAAGAYTVTATYTGDAEHAPSTSAAVSQQVGKAATTTTLEIVPNPAAPGTDVLLRATVTGFNLIGQSVTFLENNSVLGSGSIDANGVATLQTTQGKKGSRTITASYAGDASNLASASAKVRLTTK